jgi:serine/threonine protein kinase
MSTERFRQIEALYHAAREATAEERAALLARTDSELRHEVESLLSEVEGGEFLDRPAMEQASELFEDSTAVSLAAGARLGRGRTAAHDHPSLVGHGLGPYRIVGLLGRGGMGEVYEARDTRLDRTVAIKILPEQFAADPDRLVRFER